MLSHINDCVEFSHSYTPRYFALHVYNAIKPKILRYIQLSGTKGAKKLSRLKEFDYKSQKHNSILTFISE